MMIAPKLKRLGRDASGMTRRVLIPGKTVSPRARTTACDARKARATSPTGLTLGFDDRRGQGSATAPASSRRNFENWINPVKESGFHRFPQ
jgi:hypothetical protein